MTPAEPNTPVSNDNPPREPPDFSIVQGGPFFQFMRRLRLSDEALSLLHRRIIAISLFCWLPLFALSILDGQVLPRSVKVPFFLDVETHIKFLLAVPLLIAAEIVVHRRMLHLAKQFLECNLIANSAMARFSAAIASAFRLRNSLFAEVLLVAFVYIVGILFFWRQHVALEMPTCYATASAKGLKLSLAGMWYGYVSLPIFQFLLLRWYYRIFIWARFLWNVSRIELSLVPTHPDRVGGMGFISNKVYAFVPLLIAHGALMAGFIANHVLYLGAKLPGFGLDIFLLVIFLLCLVLGPLLVFAPQLVRAKYKGHIEYGALAERYVREFDAKWIREGAPANEALMGSADIQSLADMGNSFEVVESMRIMMVTKETIFQLVAAALVPIVPLVLTMIPLDELLKKLAGILF